MKTADGSEQALMNATNVLAGGRRPARPAAIVGALCCWLAAAAGAASGAEAELDEALQLLRQAGYRGGLVVQLGCGDGLRAVQLFRAGAQLVHALDVDPERVAAARRRFAAAGCSGPVAAAAFDGRRLPYVDGAVNAVICEGPAEVAEQELLRVLAPGGAALVDGRRLVKPPAAGVDEWTHFQHGPDNNPVAADRLVGSPRGLQWIAPPLWTRDHDTTPNVFGLASASGRLFYVLDEGPIGVIDRRLPQRCSLIARDAFNGVLLWKKRLPDWYPSWVQWGTTPAHLHRRLVADGQRVFVTNGLHGPVLCLDAATGALLRTYAGSDDAAELLAVGGLLVAVIMPTGPNPDDAYPSLRSEPFRRARLDRYKRRGQAVVAYDAASGRQLWRRPCAPIPQTACSDGRRLFYSNDAAIVCLDLRSGEPTWEAPGPAAKLLVADGVVVAAAEAPQDRRRNKIAVWALRAEDGRVLWRAAAASLPTFANVFYIPPELFVINGLVWTKGPAEERAVGWDLHTGAERRTVSLENQLTPGHHVRCYPAKATSRYLLLNKRGIEFVDLLGEEGVVKHDWVRGACRLGILPCNGLIYAPPNGCNCCVETYVRGFVALHSRRAPPPQPEGRRLTRGPAYEPWAIGDLGEEHASDWPTFRHDNGRTSATASAIAAPLRRRWTAALSGELAGPTAAGGRVFVAERDANTVHALRAADGRRLWSFVAGGPVDSPPTIAAGRVVFGAADGCVYCLRAADGELAWRFQAAPADRRLVAFERVASVWPCHGAVTIEDGVVYVAAGRSSYLDGGIFLYGLDLRTGGVLHRGRIRTESLQQTTLKHTFNTPGALTDILVSDGAHLYMRQLRFDRRLQLRSPLFPLGPDQAADRPRVMATAGFLDGSGNKRVYRACSPSWTGRYSPLRTQQLAVTDTTTYGCRIDYGRGWKSPRYHPGDGTLVFALDHAAAARLPTAFAVEAALQGNNNRWNFTIAEQLFRWSRRLPFYARAVVLAGDKLVAAGRLDRDVNDAVALAEGRAPGVIYILDARTGEVLQHVETPAAAVLDGLAVARGVLYGVQENGEVACYAADSRGSGGRRGPDSPGR